MRSATPTEPNPLLSRKRNTVIAGLAALNASEDFDRDYFNPLAGAILQK